MASIARGAGELTERGWLARCVAIVLGGVALRAALLAGALGIRPIRDEIFYLEFALTWFEYGVYTSGRAPGFPWFLAQLMSIFGDATVTSAKVIQVSVLAPVVGASVIALGTVCFDRRTGLVAGLLWALYLPLASFTHLIWPETLFLALFVPAIALLVAGFDARVTARSLLLVAVGGALIGLACLVKESALFLAPLVAALGFWRMGFSRRALAAAATLVLAVAVVIVPWTLRNAETYHRFAPLGMTLGTNCYFGLNAEYKNFDYTRRLLREAYPDEHWVRRAFFPEGPDGWERSELAHRVDRNSEETRRGLAYALEHPGFMVRTRIKKLADFVTPKSFVLRHVHLDLYEGWMATPAVRRSLSIVAPGMVVALLLLGAGGAIYRGGEARGAWILFAIIAYFSVLSLLVSMSRFRAPLLPALLVLAAAWLTGRRASAPAGRTRHAAFALIVVVLGFLWTLNADGLVHMASAAWEAAP